MGQRAQTNASAGSGDAEAERVLRRAAATEGFTCPPAGGAHTPTAEMLAELREAGAALPAGGTAGGMAATCTFTPGVHGCRSVNRKRLSTRKSVSSQHNRRRAWPSVARCFQAASADPGPLPPDRESSDGRSAQATDEFCRNQSVKSLPPEAIRPHAAKDPRERAESGGKFKPKRVFTELKTAETFQAGKVTFTLPGGKTG